MTVTQTYTGNRFYAAIPAISRISILDIAQHLSNIGRYNGAVLRNYNVAQHCVLMPQILPKHLKLAVLLHDADEAYLNDMTKPVKNYLPDYVALELKVSALVAAHFGVDFSDPLNKEVDLRFAELTDTAVEPDWFDDFEEPDPIFKSHGFEVVDTGGGCTNWGKRFANGTLVLAGDAENETTHRITCEKVGFIALDQNDRAPCLVDLPINEHGAFSIHLTHLNRVLTTLDYQLGNSSYVQAA